MTMNNNFSSPLWLSLQAFKPHARRALLFAVLGGLLVLAPTVYMFEVYDRVVNSRNHLTLAMLSLLVIGALVLMECLEWAKAETLRHAAERWDEAVAPQVFRGIYQAALARNGPGIQPMNDWRTLRDATLSPVLGAVLESPVAGVMLLVLFWLNPLLGWVALLAAVLQVGLAWMNERGTQPVLMQANRTAVEAQRYADGSLRNAEVIESMGMLHHIHRRWVQKQSEFLTLQAQASDTAGGFQAITKTLQQVVSSAMLGLGALLVLENTLPGGAGTMIVASVLGGRVLAPLVQMVAQWRTVINARDAWGRLDKLLTQYPEAEPAMALPAPKGRLVVEGLVAGAPGSATPIVRGVQFALNPGDVLAVVGPSASGKTSLARLLVGLWPALQGKVRLDGVDVYSWNKAELGPHVGYVPQSVELLDGTLADNISRFGDGSPAKLQAAIDAVGLQPLVDSLPQGLDTPLGRDGARLSGGQRQRVALARALYGEPVLLVLDEPNASLDEAGDAALAQAIANAKSIGTTVVVMTHRTSVLGVADKMLVMRDGQQQAFGPKDEVIAALQKAAAQGQAQAQGPASAQQLKAV
ncbi:MAG: hypothetical protein RL323_1510 [Pseudomonadota bacterium]